MNNKTLVQLYHDVLASPALSLIHKECKDAIAIIDYTVSNNEPDINQVRANQIFVEGKYFTFSDPTVWDTITKSYNLETGIATEPISKSLADKLNLMSVQILQDKRKTKFLSLFQFLFKTPNIKTFLYDYITYIVSVGYKHETAYKQTRTCIQTGEILCKFIISQNPLLKNLVDKFNRSMDEIIIKQKDLENILHFCKIILEYNIEDNEIRELFHQFNITETFTMEILFHYFRNILYTEYENANIHIAKLKAFIKSIYKEESVIIVQNIYIKKMLTIGYYLFDFFIENKIFEVITRKSIKSKHTINYVVPTSETITEIARGNSIIEPYLQPNQVTGHTMFDNSFQKIIDNNLRNLIHPNKRIKLEMNQTCYLKTNKIFTKLSVDVNYLKCFLSMLVNDKLSPLDLLAHFDIDYTPLQHMFLVAPRLSDVLQMIAVEGSRLHYLTSAPQFQRSLRKFVKDTKIEKEYRSFESTFKKLTDKLFQQKASFISALKQAIKYSPYKFFVVPGYLDSRGRWYSLDIALNIHTNNLGKALCKFYDDNGGRPCKTEYLKPLINILHYEQTKKKLLAIIQSCTHKYNTIKDLNQKHKFKYLLSFFKNVDEAWIDDCINNSLYKDPVTLLEHIKPHLRKIKKIFTAHSLIIFEQLEKQGLNKHQVTFIEKDVSSSGLQMISRLFRSPDLARISNLIGKDDFAIYKNNAQFIYNIFRKFKELFLRHYDTKYPRVDIRQYLAYQTLTLDNFNKHKDQLHECLADWIIINFETSSCVRDYALTLVKQLGEILTQDSTNWGYIMAEDLFQYIDNNSKVLFGMLEKLSEFSTFKKELRYILCLRYAVRITIICDIIIGIDELNPDALWHSRDVSKNMVMTLVYMSTAYGRKTHLLDLLTKIKPIMDTPTNYKNCCMELVSFLDRCGTAHLNTIKDLSLIYEFLEIVCQGQPVIIFNRNFKLTLNPKIETFSQVSCSSYTSRSKRPAQLIIKCQTNQFSNKKLRTMFMANLAHFMDSDIMHHYVEICHEANEILLDNDIAYSIIFERNHDAFFNSLGFLTEIFVEEAYLRFNEIDYMDNIDLLSEDLKRKLTVVSREEFISLLHKDMNPNFLK